jgi:hypothetical protein
MPFIISPRTDDYTLLFANGGCSQIHCYGAEPLAEPRGAALAFRLCGLWNRRGLDHIGPLFDTPQRVERHRKVLT